MSLSDPNPTASHTPGEPILPKTVDYPGSATPSSAGLADRVADGLPGYELLDELGRGGMGIVYRARQVKLNRVVALKTTLGSLRSDPKGLIRFLAEAEAVAALRHPNVVQVYDYGEHEGRPFLALEFLSGGTLAQQFARTGPLPAAQAAALLGQIARGVAAAHELGIIHRDLKPANVLLDDNGAPRVTDFGLAKRTGGLEITRPDAVLGTPSYMAPEQAAGRTRFVGPQADVWALGVILYEAVSGTRPFTADSLDELLVRVVNAEPAPLRSTGVPRDLELICFQCLRKDPAERFPTAAELADDLERFARGEPIRVRPAGLLERGYKWARRNPAAAAAGVLVVLALTLLGLTAGAVALWQRAESARAEAIAERSEAVAARAEAEKARAAEETARALAQKRAEEIARLNYLATIDLAGRSALSQDHEKALTLLDDCEPALRNWEWRFLKRTCLPERCLLNVQRPTEVEQKQYFFGRADFAPDSRRLLGFAGIEPILRVWDTETGKLLESRPTGDRELWDISLSLDRRRLLLMAQGSARIWNADTLEEIQHITHRGNDYPNGWLNANGSRLVVPGPRGEVRVFDTQTGKEEHLYRHPATEKVWAVGFPEGKLRLVTADVKPPKDFGAATLRVRDVEAGAAPVVIAGVTVAPNVRQAKFGVFPITIQLSADGHQVLVSGSSSSVFRPALWDDRTGKAQPFGFLQGSAWFTPDGTGVVCASGRKVQIVNIPNGALRSEYAGHPDLLRFAAVSPDGKTVIGGGGQGLPIRVWNAAGSDTVTVIPHAAGANHHVGFSPDATRMLAPDADGTVREWDTLTGEARRVMTRFEKPTSRIMYSLDGRRIAATVVSGEKDRPALVRVIDAATGRTELDVPEEGRSGGFYGFTAAGDAVYLKQANGQMGEWDLARRTWRRSLPGFDSIIAVSPDGQSLLTDDGDRRASLRNAATGAVVAPLEEFPKVASPDSVWLVAAFSSSGDRVAVGCPDLRVRIWDARTGKLVSTLRDHTKQWKVAVQFSPDGSRLVTLGLTLEMWDVETGRPVLPTGTVKHRGTTPAFSPDGRYLFLGGGFRELLVRIDTGP